MCIDDSQKLKTQQIFSIITVCLNNRSGLELTYRSIKNQSFKAFEWIIIDGGSTDGSVAFLQNLHNQTISWLSEPDHGLYDAMNKGIERANGLYLLFLNAGDNLVESDILGNLYFDAGEANWPGIIYGDALERTSEGSLLYKKCWSHRCLWYGMFTHHQSMLYKRETVGSLRYRFNYPIGADYAFTAEVLAKSNAVLRVPFAVSIFTQGGLSAHSVFQGAKDQWRIRRDILGISLFVRLGIMSFHLIMNILRKYAPPIYRSIRFS